MIRGRDSAHDIICLVILIAIFECRPELWLFLLRLATIRRLIALLTAALAAASAALWFIDGPWRFRCDAALQQASAIWRVISRSLLFFLHWGGSARRQRRRILHAYEGRGEILIPIIFVFIIACQASLSIGTGPLTGCVTTSCDAFIPNSQPEHPDLVLVIWIFAWLV